LRPILLQAEPRRYYETSRKIGREKDAVQVGSRNPHQIILFQIWDSDQIMAEA
jgi:hypothetical protein